MRNCLITVSDKEIIKCILDVYKRQDKTASFPINSVTRSGETVAIVDGSITFFVRKSSTEVTVFYYKDLFVFISHNMKKKVSLRCV